MNKPQADEDETTAVIHVTRIRPDTVDDFDDEEPTQEIALPAGSIEGAIRAHLDDPPEGDLTE